MEPPTMPTLAAFAASFQTRQVELHAIMLLMSIVQRLWEHILYQSGDKVPNFLPQDVVSLLLLALQPILATVSAADIQSLWVVLVPQVGSWTTPFLETPVDDVFRTFGEQFHLGAEMLYPPFSRCPDPACHNHRLTHPRRIFCRLYTLRRGILPIQQISLYCRGAVAFICNEDWLNGNIDCKTRYYYAYSVSDAENVNAEQVYYRDPLPYIHAGETMYFEADLCEYFELQMCLSHTSTGNLARLYNAGLAETATRNAASSLLDEVTQTAILDACFMHALLRRAYRYGHFLRLPHAGLQERRFDAAMDLYNTLMAGNGQPQYLHACHDCFKITQDGEGKLAFVRAGTTDGVTLGHPSCAAEGGNCQERLKSMKHHYCSKHHHLARKCRVAHCDATAPSGFFTCAASDHREQEVDLLKKAESAFDDLSRRLNKDNVPRSRNKRAKKKKARAVLEFIVSTDFDIFNGLDAPGPRKPKLQLTRHYSHNEQLFVLCCGIILSRATFFSAEGPASAKDFLKRTFPSPWLLPTHIFYDKACQLLKHLQAQGDHFFRYVRLVVDVFHASNHHDEAFCNANNNPALFPELRTMREGREQWTFNSSVAEQANVWFGAFQAMSREMSVPRYNFFLDEMILLRNEWLVGQQRQKAKQPFVLSEEDMKRQWLAMYSGDLEE
uniref:CxC6 like cysteine cluster associated with KDZ domain-containing protein n=1 Tax=Mycena chlorophos TaxID=658473 RepID=A0ABQ0LU79_MYCCL|nr:predicted protein [Mycena chlorophos]